jgi:hypothetical protein
MSLARSLRKFEAAEAVSGPEIHQIFFVSASIRITGTRFGVVDELSRSRRRAAPRSAATSGWRLEHRKPGAKS